MIHTIPGISINGQGGSPGNTFGGGYIYDLSYNVVKGDQGSSTLSVSLVSSTGQYSFNDSQLTLDNPYSISIGGLNLSMYAKRVRKKSSSDGTLLEIEFTDGSFILDKYFVGLHKKHGWNTRLGPPKAPYTQNKSCFIIIGHEFHPCDVNSDGRVDLIHDIQDPCHPCKQEDTQFSRKLLVDCKHLTKYEIFEVKYNFTELITELRNRGFQFSGAHDPNPKYFNNHTGTVRQVLSAWCANFGWIFFWDKNIIRFVDLRTVPILNASVQSFCPNVTDYEEEFTLDGTFNSIVLSNFTRQGIDKDFTCKRAIYLYNLPTLNQTNAPSPGLYIDSTIDQDAAGLAYYSKELRNLYYLFCKYRMNSPSDYQAGVEIKELGLYILSNALTVSAPTGGVLGNYSIEPSTGLNQPAFNARRTIEEPPPQARNLNFLEAPNVGTLGPAKEAIKGNKAFLSCFETLDAETQWTVAANLDKYFFFIGHYDQDTDNAKYEREKDFAENFIGKYNLFLPNLNNTFEREFFQDYTFYFERNCNRNVLKNDDRVSYQFLGNDGGDNLRYYNLDQDASGNIETLSALPFARFLQIISQPEGGSFSSYRIPKLVVVEKSSQGFYPANIDGHVDFGSIYPNSEGNWYIQDNALKNRAYTYFIKGSPVSNNQNGENIARLILNSDALNIDKNKTFIFLGYSPGDDAFQYNSSSGNNRLAQGDHVFFNGAPIQPEIDPITHLPKTELVYQYPELLCNQLGLNGNGECRVGNFHTPVGTFKFYFPTYASYNCILEKTRQVLKRVEKYESVFSQGECGSKTTMALDVQSINITDEDLKKFYKTGPNSCVFNDQAIRSFHDNIAKNISISQKTPLIKKTFTVAGILHSTLGIKQGLQSVSISVNDQGVKSTYSFGTTHMLKSDPNVYSESLQNFNMKNVLNNNNGVFNLKPR